MLGLILTVALAVGCTSNSAPETPAFCVESAPGSSGIVGELHFVMTVGSVTASDYSWAASKPHSGMVVVQTLNLDHDSTQRHRVGRAGTFSIGLSPGRYRVTGYIPGVTQMEGAEVPKDSHVVAVQNDRCTPVRLLVYEEEP
jgi:hypothetical protein